jgi:hypothetical protein
MKKVIRLTESDLVNIVKRVINEQTKYGPVIPEKYKNYSVDISELPIDLKKNLGVGIKEPEDFMNRVQNLPIKLGGFYLETEGWKFPIFPVSYNKENFSISLEPFDDKKTMMVRWKKGIPYKK